jgi:hypothetical protein
MIALYLNLFVLVVQLFKKVPALHVLAPTQSEGPFKLTQLAVLTIFVVLSVLAAIRFRVVEQPELRSAQSARPREFFTMVVVRIQEPAANLDEKTGKGE